MRFPLLPLRDSFNISLSHHRVLFPHVKPQFWCGLLLWGLHYLDAHLVSLGSWPVMGASLLTPSGQLRVTEKTPACAVPLEDFPTRIQC